MIEPKITFDQYTGVPGFRSQVKELTTAKRQKKKTQASHIQKDEGV